MTLPDPPASQDAAAAASQLPAHVAETVQLIAQIHAEHHQSASTAQRIVDKATALAGRPLFLGLVCALAAIWIVLNSGLFAAGAHAPDPPPFAWLELALTLTALVMAVLILVTQRRADVLAGVRVQMTLELTILTEQKVAKIIELVEELRRDSPAVRDRVDSEARDMATKADPHAVHGAIDEINREMKVATDLQRHGPESARAAKTDVPG